MGTGGAAGRVLAVIALLLLTGGAVALAPVAPAPPGDGGHFLGGGAGHRVPTGGTPTDPVGPWGAWTGRPSPGAPHYRLTTASLASSSCAASSGRAWLAYDSAVQSFWVAAPPSCVAVVLASQPYNVSASYPVGTDPFGVAIDGASHEVYVTNAGSDNVTVLNDSTGAPVASIAVGSSPAGIAYDPSSHLLFVANNGSDNVSVINGSVRKVVATVAVGTGPVGVAVDPASHRVFVADFGSDNLTVFPAGNLAVRASIPVGRGPYGVAVDNRTDAVYVTNEISNNVSVLNATTDAAVATIPVAQPAMDLQGVAYDSQRDLVWVGGGYSFAVVLNATSNEVGWYLSTDPSGMAFDPDSGQVCMTNTGNFTFACVSNLNWASSAARLEFAETGLAAGTLWSVGIGPSLLEETAQVATSPTIVFGVWTGWASQSYSYSIASASGAVPSPTVGNLTVYATANYSTSTTVRINVTFGPPPPTYLLTFVANGLPVGAVWGVTVGDVSANTTAGSLVLAEPNGTYDFTVLPAAGFAAAPAAGVVTLAGAPLTVPVNFTALPPPTAYVVAFVETGLPTGTAWTVTVNGTTYSAASTVLTVSLTPGTYAFAVGNLSGFRATPAAGTVLVTNASVTVDVVFSPVYALTFIETGLPPGAPWTVSVGEAAQTSTGSAIAFSLGPGLYAFNVSTPSPPYDASPAAGTVSVGTDTVVPITFRSLPPPPPATYLVTFSEEGLPPGSFWAVLVNGSMLNDTGSVLSASVANGTYGFLVLPAPGFVATPASGSLGVAGGPVNVSVRFSPEPSGVPVPLPGLVPPLVLYESVLLAGALGAAGGLGLGIRSGARPPKGPPA